MRHICSCSEPFLQVPISDIYFSNSCFHLFSVLLLPLVFLTWTESFSFTLFPPLLCLYPIYVSETAKIHKAQLSPCCHVNNSSISSHSKKMRCIKVSIYDFLFFFYNYALNLRRDVTQAIFIVMIDNPRKQRKIILIKYIALSKK